MDYIVCFPANDNKQMTTQVIGRMDEFKTNVGGAVHVYRSCEGTSCSSPNILKLDPGLIHLWENAFSTRRKIHYALLLRGRQLGAHLFHFCNV